MATGIAHDKQTQRKVLYRTDNLRPREGADPWTMGVCIWLPDSNEIRPLALREFHDRYTVDRRFDMERMRREIL